MFKQFTARIVCVVGLGIIGAAAAGAPAIAEWSDAECDPTALSCEVAVGTDPEPATGDGGSSDNTSGTESGGGGGTADPDAGLDCENTLKESDADSHAQAGERPSPEHQLMFKTCTDPATGTSTQTVQWVAPGEEGVPVDPAVLAQEAVDRLRLPQPQIASSPQDYQLVRLPTWLWLDGNSWSAQSASASVPGLTITATATPVKATWDLGDGSTVSCESAGTEWTAEYDAKAPSPDCGHTYARSSAHVPNGEYAVSVVVEWAISWSGGGQTGTEPGMSTTAQVSWQVAESQATVQ